MVKKIFFLLSVCCVILSAAELIPKKEYSFEELPQQLEYALPAGKSVTFRLMENGTTGYQWTAKFDSKACKVTLTHGANPAPEGMCGVPGYVEITIEKLSDAPVSVTLLYVRPWETAGKPAQQCTILLKKQN